MGRRSNRGRGRRRPGNRGQHGGHHNDQQPPQQPPSDQAPPQEGEYNRYRDQSPPRTRNLPSMMRRMFLGATADISIIIRTENGDAWLEELLASLREQSLPQEVETLAVDADSTDRTPLILRSRGIRTLHARPGSDYLDQVLKAAEGDIIVFLTQDTLPLKNDWLKHLCAPLLEDRHMGLAYGRVIADATVPAYQRGLISARPYVSGKQTLGYTSADFPGAHYFPTTNLAGRKKALMQLGSLTAASQSLTKLYNNDWTKFYLPHATAVIKGESTSQALFESLARRTGPDSTAFSNMLKDEFAGLLAELYELSSSGDLPNGQRGDAYFSALSLHSQRALRLLQERHPSLKKLFKK